LCNPTMAPGLTLGGTYHSGDGYLDPPRNVVAYAVALAHDGVHVAERTTFLGLDRDAAGRVAGVRSSAGDIAAPQVILAGGPSLAELGRRCGVTLPVGRVRHQVAVTSPHPDLDPNQDPGPSGAFPMPMVFDLAMGLYWRPESGGLLFGMSNPDEPEGEALAVDWPYLERIRRRLAELVPVTHGLGLRKAWAATIEYTPDHLPIIGPARDADGVVPGLTVTCAGGHGMMCGPGIARATADLVLAGHSDVVDVDTLGLDRFDAGGVSRYRPDPIALPFPQAVTVAPAPPP